MAKGAFTEINYILLDIVLRCASGEGCRILRRVSSYPLVRNRQNFKTTKDKANTHVQKWAWVVCAYCGMALPSL